ncbi:hypothetical protein BD324DRAFT_681543 [Kockovaella imperatae]|uniref:Exosome complex protein n=1 Tax=Kockovaella imperatae TaxID=4999 RepID=A0A1Y1UFH5_9TREE|nr:hypothetical protein BD324DRAFT_681543 [Kockovaella imperatae]ORX36778.1 hypothetical protein BD324DRAFT_681543 [Kockovaella imperatae]
MMADSDPSESIAGLLKTLPELEQAFEAVLSRPSWTETVDQMNPLDRAKLDILMAYAINDLVWMYLKVKGVDPASHDVSTELDRIKTYYGKIRAAEEPKAQPSRKIDVPAANRFISSAIPKSQKEHHASTSAQAMAQSQAKRAVEEAESIERTGMDRRFRFVAETGQRLENDEDGEDEEPGGDDDEEMESDEGNHPQHIVFDDDGEPVSQHSGDQQDTNTATDEEPKPKRRRKRAEDFA